MTNATADSRIEIAATAYGAPYDDPERGLKASAEDAILSVLVALYPGEYPAHDGEGMDKLRGDERLNDLADLVWETMECEGLGIREIAERLVPEIDGRMVGYRRAPWTRPRLPAGQIRASVNKQGAMKLYVPAAIARLVTQDTVFQPELTDEGLLFRYVEGQEPVKLPRWMGGD
jgi:hypothetical protein